MTLVHTIVRFSGPGAWGRRAIPLPAFCVACLCAVTAGCSQHSESAAASAGVAPAGATSGPATITPAQEAAKKRAMDQGPAIAAAAAAARGKK